MADRRPGADDVLSGLPRTRPQRSNPKRDAARAKAAGPASGASGAGGSPAAKPKPKAAAKPKPKAAAKPRTAAKPTAPAPRPAPPRGYATPKAQAQEAPDLATTAVQAAGELLGLGGRVIKGVLDRLPRP